MNIDDITKTGFEVRIADRIDEIAVANKMEKIEDVELLADWPLIPDDEPVEVKINIVGMSGKVETFIDVEFDEEDNFEIILDEGYIVSRLEMLNIEM